MGDIFNLSCCILCPRECKVDRTKGEKGMCGTSDKIYSARAELHMWEEPCLTGTGGSGTVFFSGCSLKCVFCQNNKISHHMAGYEISIERLCEIFFELKNKGAENINLVTATHFLPQVLKAVKMAKEKGFDIPFVYNSSGYEKQEALKLAEGLIDIFLPDFKYIEDETALKYSGVKNYPAVAMSAIDEMVRQQPRCVFDENGILKNGVLVRHLVLPARKEESKKIINYLYKTYKNKIYMSIMSQYTPHGNLKDFPELLACVSEEDYNEIIDFAIKTGVENAFIQEGEASSESFIPDFSGQGIIKEV